MTSVDTFLRDVYDRLAVAWSDDTSFACLQKYYRTINRTTRRRAGEEEEEQKPHSSFSYLSPAVSLRAIERRRDENDIAATAIDVFSIDDKYIGLKNHPMLPKHAFESNVFVIYENGRRNYYAESSLVYYKPYGAWSCLLAPYERNVEYLAVSWHNTNTRVRDNRRLICRVIVIFAEAPSNDTLYSVSRNLPFCLRESFIEYRDVTSSSSTTSATTVVVSYKKPSVDVRLCADATETVLLLVTVASRNELETFRRAIAPYLRMVDRHAFIRGNDASVFVIYESLRDFPSDYFVPHQIAFDEDRRVVHFVFPSLTESSSKAIADDDDESVIVNSLIEHVADDASEFVWRAYTAVNRRAVCVTMQADVAKRRRRRTIVNTCVNNTCSIVSFHDDFYVHVDWPYRVIGRYRDKQYGQEYLGQVSLINKTDVLLLLPLSRIVISIFEARACGTTNDLQWHYVSSGIETNVSHLAAINRKCVSVEKRDHVIKMFDAIEQTINAEFQSYVNVKKISNNNVLSLILDQRQYVAYSNGQTTIRNRQFGDGDVACVVRFDVRVTDVT